MRVHWSDELEREQGAPCKKARMACKRVARCNYNIFTAQPCKHLYMTLNDVCAHSRMLCVLLATYMVCRAARSLSHPADPTLVLLSGGALDVVVANTVLRRENPMATARVASQ